MCYFCSLLTFSHCGKTWPLNSAPPVGKNCPHQRHRRGFLRDLGLFERHCWRLVGNSCHEELFLLFFVKTVDFPTWNGELIFFVKKLQSWVLTELFIPVNKCDVQRISCLRKLWDVYHEIHDTCRGFIDFREFTKYSLTWSVRFHENNWWVKYYTSGHQKKKTGNIDHEWRLQMYWFLENDDFPVSHVHLNLYYLSCWISQISFSQLLFQTYVRVSEDIYSTPQIIYF